MVRVKQFLFLIVSLVCLVCFFIFSKTHTSASVGNPAIEQQINLLQGAPTSASNGSQGIVYIDPARYPGATYYFEVVAKETGSPGSVSFVYNAGTGSTISGGSSIAITNISASSYTRYRSAGFSIASAGNAYITFSSAGLQLEAARLIVDQTNNAITDTQTRIHLSGNATTTSTTDVIAGNNMQQWTWNPNNYDGTVTTFFEVSGENQTAGQTSTYSLYVAGASCTSQVSGSAVTITGNTFQRVRSNAINLSSGTTYMVCMSTTSGGTAKISLADVIIDQTSPSGLTKMELYKYSIVSATATSSASYVSAITPLYYDPSVWTGGTFTYYYEANMKSSSTSATASAQLYNNTDTGAISGSSVATTSASYTLVRSGSITMPGTAKELDMQLKNDGTHTTTVDTSELVIDVTGLAINPTPTNTPTPTPSSTPTPTPIATYTLSGTVFVDTNADGVEDNGETGYTGGATVTLSSGDTVTTNASGYYSFSNIPTGTYTVTVSATGYSYTTSNPVMVPLSANTSQNFGIQSLSGLKGGNPAIEQRIPLMHGTATSAANGSAGIAYVDTSRYPGATYYFEVVAKVTSGTGSADLVYNAGTGATPTAGSRVTISNIAATSYTIYRSSSFSLTTGNVYLDNLTGTGIQLEAARIIIDQTNTAITDTQTHIEIGANSTSNATTDTPIGGGSMHQWVWNSNNYDGTVTTYLEVSGENQTAGQTTTYSLYVAGSSCTTQVSGSTLTIVGNTYQRFRSSAITLTSGTPYMICYHTSAGGTAQITLGSIIIDQTATGGLTKMELYHYSSINLKGTSNATFATQVVPFRFDPSVWAGGYFTYYYEANISTSNAAATASAQLYNTTDATAISGSILSTTSTTYTILRSSSLTLPSSAKNLDTQLENDGTDTTDIDTAALVIDVSGLQASPTPTPTSYALSGTVFVDSNSNGVQDGQEAGYTGSATVTLTGTTTVTTTTDPASGSYSFTGLSPGTYTVAVILPGGYIATTNTPVSVPISGNTTQNFGINTVSSTKSGSPSIEQQINLLQGAPTSASNGSQGIVYVDPARYPGATYYVEVDAKVASNAGTVSFIYNAGTGSTLSPGSSIAINNITATTYTRYRSAAFSISSAGNAYLSFTSANTGLQLDAARLIIDQTNNAITDTQTHIHLGGFATTTSTTDVIAGNNMQQWTWNPNNYDGMVTTSFEVSGENQIAGQTSTYSLYVAGASCTSQVSGSAVTITGNTYQRVRSAAITLNSGTTYMVCMNTSAGGTAKLSLASVIIDQTSASGLTKMELYQYNSVSGATTTSASYALVTAPFYYNPAVWAGGSFTYYYEANVKTNNSTATASAQLYNTTDATVITNASITTTSTNYSLLRSQNLTMPSTAKTVDSQIKNDGTHTTSIDIAALVIDVNNLAITATPTPTVTPTPYQTTVTVDTTKQIGTISSNYIGWSLDEQWICKLVIQEQSHPEIDTYIKNLNPLIIRIGGGSADGTTWNPSAAGCPQNGQDLTISQSLIDAVAALAKKDSFQVYWAVNLKASDSATFSQEAAYAAQSFGSNLAGIMFGNEPDLYGWSYSTFQTQWENYYTAFRQLNTSTPIVAPEAAYAFRSQNCSDTSNWLNQFLLSTDVSKVTAASFHSYFSNVNNASVSGILDAGNMGRYSKFYGCNVSVANKIPLPLRMTEYDSSSGVVNNVTNVFADSLWGLDYLFNTAEADISGVNIYASNYPGATTENVALALINNATNVQAQPSYYPLFLFHNLAEGGTLVKTTLPANLPVNVVSHAVVSSDGKLQVFLINKDQTNDTTLQVSVPAGYTSGTDIRMQSPSVTSQSVTLGGNAIALDGTWSVNPSNVESVTVSNNAFTISVPHASAVAITLASTAPTPTPTTQPIYTLSGTVFNDLDGNGFQGSGEGGISGATVTLSGNASGTTTTDSSGFYSFTNLPAGGNYIVTLTLPNGYTMTTTNPAQVPISANSTQNFGIAPLPTNTPTPTVSPSPTNTPTPTTAPVYTLGGTVFIDVNDNGFQDATESGYGNATINLSGPVSASATTDTSGYFYSFPNLPAGTYTVTLTTPSGYALTTSNPVVVTVNANTTVNFGITPTGTLTPTPTPIYSVFGTVFIDTNDNGVQDTSESGYQNATITLSGNGTSTATTSASGSYTFPNVQGGNYTITLTLPNGYTATTPNPVTVPVNANTQVNFGIITAPTATTTPTPTVTPPVNVYTLTGTVFADANQNGTQDTGENGIQNVSITLSDNASGISITDTTGSFIFTNLAAGTYTVTLKTPTGYTLSTFNPVTVPVNANTVVNFGLIPPPSTPTPTPTVSNTSTNSQASPPVITNGSSPTTNPNQPPGYYAPIMAGPHYLGSSLPFFTGSSGAENAATFIPFGALHDDAAISITHATPQGLLALSRVIPFPWMQGINTAGEMYKYQVTASWNGMLIQQFDKPVIIMLPYDSHRLYRISPKQLKIAFFNQKTRRWQFLTTPMVVNTQDHTVATTIKSFSYFTIGYAKY